MPREGPLERVKGRHESRPSTTNGDLHSADSTANSTASAAVSWWTVHEHVSPLLDAVGSWPMAGTPEWVALPDDDPAKIAALFDAARHWALRVDTSQEAWCQASRAVSAAADWAAIGREIRSRNDFYRSRPWLKRVIA